MDAGAPLGPALWLPKPKYGFPLNRVSTSRLRALASGSGVNAAAATRAELLESAHKSDVQGAALEWSCKALRVYLWVLLPPHCSSSVTAYSVCWCSHCKVPICRDDVLNYPVPCRVKLPNGIMGFWSHTFSTCICLVSAQQLDCQTQVTTAM